MDQSLLDSARYKITNVSIDSRFADRQFSCTGDFQIRMPSSTKNIMRIALSSIEIPNVEWVFSAARGNTVFQTSFDGVNWSAPVVAVTDGNYDPATLVADVEAALQGVIPAATLTYYSATQQVVLNLPAGQYVRWLDPDLTAKSRATHWGLGYYLGFRAPVTGPGTTAAPSIVLTESNPYYLIQLQAPDPLEGLQHRLYDGSWLGAFAKVVLRNGIYTTINFDDGGNMLRKEYTFLSPTNITNLRIRVLDPFGQVVNLHDVNWSLTLELYEVVNSRVYSTIAETFQRM